MLAARIAWSCILLLAVPRIGTGRQPDRRCAPAEKPKHLPAVAELLDSVAFLGRLPESALPDSLLLSLVFSPEGALTTVRPIEGTALATAAVEAIRTTLRPQNTPGPWAIRVRLLRNPTRSVRIERSIYCPVQPAQGEAATIGRIEVRPGDRMPRAGTPVRLEVEVAVDATGRPERVELLHGSGLRDLDDEVVRRIQSTSYLPALIDGLPIASWFRTTGARQRF